MSLGARACARARLDAVRLVAGVAASLLAILPALPLPAPATAQTPILPQPPLVFLDTTFTPPAGQTITVAAGGDFQAALNAANPGDTIVLQAGATYSGNFTLPYKVGTGWIYIETSALASLPVGNRVSPANAAQMPRIISPNTGATISTAAAAHNYRFVGVEITTTWASTTATDYGLIILEAPGGNTSLAQVPTDIVFDRCYIHGTPTGNVRRGIAMNSARTAVIDSYLAEFHEIGADTQTVGSWNGPGPFKIVNNNLQAAGENVMFGGADPSITNLVPSDIEIRGNYFFKPLSWRAGDPSYAGIPWTVKNLFELKNAQRVLVTGNIFENNWAAAQNGFSILDNVTNQSGTAPWSTVRDVMYRYNIFRHMAAGITFQGYNWINAWPSVQGQRWAVQNNVFVDVGAYASNGGHVGWLTLWLCGPANVTLDHNTFFQSSFAAYAATGCPAPLPNVTTGFFFTNNIASNDFTGDGGPIGTATLTQYFPGAVFVKNVLVGDNAALYPPTNFFPPTFDPGVGFVNFAGGDYHLAVSSPYKNAGTDGKDIGADIDGLNAATANTLTGITSTSPVLSVTPVTTTDFGSVTVGTTADRSFTVTNIGMGTLVGTASTAAPFSVVSGGSFSLGGGASQTVVVRFSPTASGGFSGSLSFALNGGSGSVVLTGTGVVPAPILSVTPVTPVDFGSVMVGTTADRSFTVTNTGGGTLTGAASTAAPFSVVSGGSFSLGGGASQTVVVRFTPTAAGAFGGNVSFGSNGGTVSVVLTGTGVVLVPILSVTPSTPVDFGSVMVGTTADQSFTVTNTGGGTLTGTASTAAPFSVVSGGSFSLGGGGSQTVVVRFSPTATGSVTGSVSFSSNGGTASVTVTGTGAVLKVAVSWTGMVNATAIGNVLQNVGGPGSGGYSAQRVVGGDGFVEVTVTDPAMDYVLSLGNVNTAGFVGGRAVHFGMYRAEVREGNWAVQANTFAKTGDIFRIAVVGGLVQYSKNGTVFFTSPTPMSIYQYPLAVFASLWSFGATVSNANVSGTFARAIPRATTTAKVQQSTIVLDARVNPFACGEASAPWSFTAICRTTTVRRDREVNT